MNQQNQKLQDLTLTIRGENGFGSVPRPEAGQLIASKLRELANRIEVGDTNPQTDELDRLNIMDVNGNSCGLCEITWEEIERVQIECIDTLRRALRETWEDALTGLDLPTVLDESEIDVRRFSCVALSSSGAIIVGDNGTKDFGIQPPDDPHYYEGGDSLLDRDDFDSINQWLATNFARVDEEVCGVQFIIEMEVECVCEQHYYQNSAVLDWEVIR